MLKEKRELVLLIEDFSTLAGVQRGLLDVIKMEGIHAGKQVLCPLRTALAVTDGFLTGYDTIKTRAGQEFVLREQPADEREVLEPVRKSCRVQRDFPSGQLDEDARQVRDFVEALGAGATDAAVKHRRDALTRWANDTRSWLGADFDKKAFVKECGELMAQAKNLGVFQANVEYKTLGDYAKAFDEAAVTEVIAAVDRLKDDAEPGVVLTALVRAPDDATDAAQKFRLAFTAFVDQSFPAAVTKVRIALAGVADPNADPDTLLPAEGKKLDDDLKAIADALPAEETP